MSEAPRHAYLSTEIGGKARNFALPEDSAFCIGRGEKNNVVLNDHQVSRLHAMIQCINEGRYYLTDKSTNGTFVNGSKITAPVTLKNGDRIEIGQHHFIFSQEASLQSTDTVSGSGGTTKPFFVQMLITVLVADIRDFAPLANRMEPRTLSLITGSMFRKADKALKERDAWIQKYIGDAVMAVWRHRNSTPGAGDFLGPFEGLMELVRVCGGLQEAFGLDEPIRIGASINTGWASVGNVGGIMNSDYTALGEVVNRAFRLESTTRQLACDMAVGQGTYDFLKKVINPEPFFQEATVQLKGFPAPETAYTRSFTDLEEVVEALRQATHSRQTIAKP
jgi:adenylate cyclase